MTWYCAESRWLSEIVCCQEVVRRSISSSNVARMRSLVALAGVVCEFRMSSLLLLVVVLPSLALSADTDASSVAGNKRQSQEVTNEWPDTKRPDSQMPASKVNVSASTVNALAMTITPCSLLATCSLFESCPMFTFVILKKKKIRFSPFLDSRLR